MDWNIFAAGIGGGLTVGLIGEYRLWKAARKDIRLEPNGRGEYVDSLLKWEKRAFWLYIAVIVVIVIGGMHELTRTY